MSRRSDMGYSVTASQDGCYPGSTVLVNKLGLRDQSALDRAESVAFAFRSAEIELKPCNEPFTFDFYRSLHKRLFGDIYEWAGEIRTIDFSKGGTSFYPARELEFLSEAKFRRLQKMSEFRFLPQNVLIDELTDFYNELNMLHPFREGNGRTQRLFFTLLLSRLGYHINFAECDTTALMTATIYAAQGIRDFLHEFFERVICGNQEQPF